jgi:hypothetical protein
MSTSRAAEKRLKSVDFYSSENRSAKEFSEVESYLEAFFPSVKFSIRPVVVTRVPRRELDAFAEALASSRMKDPSSAEQAFEPMFGEIEYERRAIRGMSKVGGIVYDGRMLQDVLVRLLGGRASVEVASIVFTDRLTSTYSRDDLHHHLRTIVCGFPSIISIPGVVEAPAKPREYYLMKQRMELEGAGELMLERLKSSFEGRFVDYDDPEILEVLKGLALQAVLYHLTLDPFCDNRACRLFNAHWQKDLIGSQISAPKLCKKHAKQLASLGRNPVVSW